MAHPFGRRAFSGALALVLTALPGAARLQAQGETSESVYKRTLKGTVWIMARRGTDRGAMGTGCLIDKSHRLVVTNFHVVGEGENQGSRLPEDVRVLFPQFEGGKLIAERSHYFDLLRLRRAIPATVLVRDKKHDLAVLKLERVPQDAQAIPLSSGGASPAQHVHCIANPGRSDALWEYTSGTVRQRYHKKWLVKDGNQVHQFEAEVLETQLPSNPGDSGGPVVNDRGELVGITQGIAIGDVQLISLSIDVREVKSLLKGQLPRIAAAVARESKQQPAQPAEESTNAAADKDPNEKRAAQQLTFAKAFADDGQSDKAKKYYEKLIAEFPNTRAASEAKILLDKLNK
jgi:S1-C subfamily serine protease